jgi:DNA-binding MarR family transcriptional regulator
MTFNIPPSHPDHPDESETPSGSLAGRLFYLFVLLRRGEARLRHHHQHVHGHQGGRQGVFEGQGRALRLLSLRSPISQKELAYLLGIRSQSLAELLRKLEDAELVSRSPDPDDRRTAVVEITAAGRDAIDAQGDVLDDDPFSVLDADERARLAELLDKVIDGLEARFPGGVDRRLQSLRRAWLDADDIPWGFGPAGRRRGPAPRGGVPYGRPGRDPRRGSGYGRDDHSGKETA